LKVRNHQGWAEVSFTSPKTGEVKWKVSFAPASLDANLVRHPASLPVLEAEHLTKRFVTRQGWRRTTVTTAVDDVCLRIARGRTLALVGESGSGKTTTAWLVARLMSATQGTIRVLGQDAPRISDRQGLRRYRQMVQVVFQDPFAALNPVHDIEHHLLRPMLSLGVARSGVEAAERATQLVEAVGLTPASEYLGKMPHELSGGQRQRVVIARALAAQPKLLLADEPTSMLDVSMRTGIMNLLLDLAAERGLGMLYITHDLAGARYVSDEISVMYAGRVVEHGVTDEVVTEPAHPYTRLLLSSVFSPEHRGVLSAVPDTETAGEQPGPQGCPFAPRCPYVMDICRQAMPPLQTLDDGREVRCHLYAGRDGTASAAASEPPDQRAAEES
jgi:peptide/nickel transport system ATP-binding protein